MAAPMFVVVYFIVRNFLIRRITKQVAVRKPVRLTVAEHPVETWVQDYAARGLRLSRPGLFEIANIHFGCN